jgi:hypothetical protein
MSVVKSRKAAMTAAARAGGTFVETRAGCVPLKDFPRMVRGKLSQPIAEWHFNNYGSDSDIFGIGSLQLINRRRGTILIATVHRKCPR